MAFENEVVEDVKAYLIDAIDEYTGCGTQTWGSELYLILLSEPNANGTLDFSRQISHEYLLSHKPSLDAFLEWAISDGLLDFEDVYEWSDDDEPGYDDYVHYEAEKIKVMLFIELAEAILAECPCVADRIGSIFDLDDKPLMETLKSEIQSVDPQAVGEYF